MNKSVFFTVLLLLLILLFVQSESFAAERKVFCEIFTNTYCPRTPGPIAAIQDMLEDNYDDDEYIFMTYHTWWPGAADPWFDENYTRQLPDHSDCRIRMDWMGWDQFLGVPSFFFDGFRIDYHDYGNLDAFADDAADLIDERLETETPLEIEISTEYVRHTLKVMVKVSTEENLTNLTLFTALCEKEKYYNAPSGQERFTGNMLDIVPDGRGTRFNVVRGFARPYNYEFDLDIGWLENEPRDLFVTAWIQDDEMEILQSERLDLSADLLLVDASVGDAYNNVWESFGLEGIPFAEHWDREEDGEIETGSLIGYKTVVYHSYLNDDELLTADEKNELMAFLDDGGTLILSAPELLKNVTDEPFFSDYLNVSSSHDETTALQLLGNPDDLCFSDCELWMDYIVDVEVDLPVLEPNGEAQAIMYYGESEYIAAVVFENETYRVMTLGFPIEAISGEGETDDLNTFVDRIFNWVYDPLAAPESGIPGEKTFELLPAYPNPFNAIVNVDFSLNRAGNATISIVDIAGREIAELANHRFNTGSHHLSWDASGNPAGVYLLKLETVDNTRMQKLIYMK